METQTIRTAEPAHHVKDAGKFSFLRTSMERDGWTGRPLLGYDDGNGVHLLTGSHRYAAARALDLGVPVYVIDAIHQGAEDYEEHLSECWICQMIEARDDDDRLAAIEQSGDDDAITLMHAEQE